MNLPLLASLRGRRLRLAGAALVGGLWVAAVTPAVAAETERDTADFPSADLVVANRYVATLREGLYGAAPLERVEGTQERIAALVDRGGPLEVTVRTIPEGKALEIDGHLVFRLLAGDADPEGRETLTETASAAAGRLQLAINEVQEARNARALLPGVAISVVATTVLVGALWLLSAAYRRLSRWIHVRMAERLRVGGQIWGGHWLGRSGAANIVTAPLRLAFWLAALGLIYVWAGIVLTRFPYTRPWGESLRDNLLEGLGRFGSNILRAVPGLLFVLLIFFLARMVVRVVRAFFQGVQESRVEVGWVDETTARPTERLVTSVIWLFALVAAYPYLPGSGSEAFKGIGVFVGLMLSIGASGIVNQAVSGLMLMYTKAVRPGEFVQIGEYEGVVKSVGFINTRLETLRHEEINIPNSVIAGTTTRNYSRLAGAGGVRVATKLTIGYDTPWRQVHALLMLASGRSTLVVKDPPPRVLQTALQDFYVEYTLLVTVKDPTQRMAALTDLHGQILDAFNEHGVQITSPNYEADPAEPKIVPRERWHAAPAAPPGASAGGAAEAFRES